MASTFTPYLDLEKPARNDYNNTWDLPVNANWSKIDDRLGKVTTVALSSSDVTLTEDQTRCAEIIFTGTITANIDVTLNAAVSGMFVIYNSTTGNFKVNVTGGGTPVEAPNFVRILVFKAASNIDVVVSSDPPGIPEPWLSAIIPSSHLLLNGQAVSRTTYPGLFYYWGVTYGPGDGSTTFNVPDLRGRLLAGLDTMGAAAASRLTSIGGGTTLGAAGGAQTHTLITSEISAHAHGLTDPGHGHGITDPTHQHTVGFDVGAAAGAASNTAGGGTFFANTSASATGISINAAATNITMSNAGGGGAHNNVQPTMLCNWIARKA